MNSIIFPVKSTLNLQFTKQRTVINKTNSFINQHMKTTFKQYLLEAPLPPAKSLKDLLDSLKDGKFTKDASHLEIAGNLNLTGTNVNIPKKITSLKGVPYSVSRAFDCSDNLLTSLEGSPSKVGTDYHCHMNQLTTLEGAPATVPGNFYCSENKLTSLKGAPAFVGGNFSCQHCRLTSLEGAPKNIASDFYCGGNQLKSLKDIHKQIHTIGRYASFDGNQIESHVLGLLKIKKLEEVTLDNKEVEKIINRYLPEGDLFACQQELIDAGYEEYAQL